MVLERGQLDFQPLKQAFYGELGRQALQMCAGGENWGNKMTSFSAIIL
jgi:hypothetical protein